MCHATQHPLVYGLAAWTLLLSAPPAVSAQSTGTGTIQGQVVDGGGTALAAVSVTIEAPEGSAARIVTTTTDDGSFVRPGMPAGRYRVTAEKTGFGLQTFDVRVHPGHGVEVRFQLIPGRGAGVALEDVNPETAARLEKVFNVALAAMRAGEPDAAIAGFREAIVVSARCHQCYYNLGLAGAQKRDFALAEESFRKAIDLKPDYVEAYNRLAGVFVAQRKFVEAQAATREAERHSEGPGRVATAANAVDGPYNEGIILWNLGKIPEARERFREVLRRNVEHPEAHYWLAMADLNEGRVADATSGFDTYLRLAPAGPYAAQARQALAQIRRE